MHLCIIICMNADPSLRAEALLIADKAKKLGLSQEQIAAAVDASQSQVSRVLSGTGKRRSRLFDRVCKYVFSQAKSAKSATTASASKHPALSAALADVWDGSEEHAEALALVIRSLGVFQRKRRSVRAGESGGRC
jgi:transcriptional regulator with XRE-family HTH domain